VKNYSFFVLLVLIFISCKDPIYQQCDKLCTQYNQCIKENQPLNITGNWENRIYANCVDACMIYNQEIFECYNEKKIQDQCKLIFECTMPVFLNQ
jgi:Cys-rich protein (TIGR04453 family)